MRISDWSSDVCSSDLENAVVFAVGFLDLVERLGDEESADAVARHEGKARLEEVEPPERRKLVEHHQELMLAPLRPVGVELLGPPPPALVENEADERLAAADVRWGDANGGEAGWGRVCRHV